MVLLYVKGLSTDFHVLPVHMTSSRRSFNEITYYVIEIERVQQVWQDKTCGNYNGLYFKNSSQQTYSTHLIQLAFLISVSCYSGVTQLSLAQVSKKPLFLSNQAFVL